MDAETINRRIEQYTKIKDFKQGLETDVGSLQLRIEKATNTKANLANELIVIEEKIKEYNDNKELIENLEKSTHDFYLWIDADAFFCRYENILNHVDKSKHLFVHNNFFKLN